MFKPAVNICLSKTQVIVLVHLIVKALSTSQNANGGVLELKMLMLYLEWTVVNITKSN